MDFKLVNFFESADSLDNKTPEELNTFLSLAKLELDELLGKIVNNNYELKPDQIGLLISCINNQKTIDIEDTIVSFYSPDESELNSVTKPYSEEETQPANSSTENPARPSDAISDDTNTPFQVSIPEDDLPTSDQQTISILRNLADSIAIIFGLSADKVPKLNEDLYNFYNALLAYFVIQQRYQESLSE